MTQANRERCRKAVAMAEVTLPAQETVLAKIESSVLCMGLHANEKIPHSYKYSCSTGMQLYLSTDRLLEHLR